MTDPRPVPRARHHRSRARAWAARVLYEWECGDGARSPAEVLDRLLADTRVHPERVSHLRRIIDAYSARREDLDGRIADALEHWTFERLGSMDRQILRVGATELLHLPNVPDKVAIHEAVRLAERYGNDDSARFVNGILDSLRRGANERGSA